MASFLIPEAIANLSSNSTDLHHTMVTGWVSSPKARGTWEVLWSCVITLSICIYTALHLNVPPTGEGKRYKFLRKAKWVICGLFAPEIVVYMAWYQFSEARKLKRKMRELLRKQGNSAVKWPLSLFSLGIKDRLAHALC